jgi:hypothetical protein
MGQGMAKREQAPSAGVDIYSTSTSAMGTNADSRWWVGPPERTHEKMVATARRILKNQAGQDQADREYLAMYYGTTLSAGMPYGATGAATTARGKRLTYNIVKNIVDAFSAEMVQSKPKATFLTNDADHDLQQRARAMEKWTDGMLHDLGFYDVRRQAWTDAGIWGDGIWKVWEERESEASEDEDGEKTGPVDRIFLERVQAPMLIADEGECRDGAPRSVYERRWMDKLVAMHQWPKHARAISDARRNEAEERTLGFDSTADQVLIWEGYHLPSRRGAKDGMHQIAIEGATLFSEPWEDDYFPYVKLRRVDPPVGFRAISGAEELSGSQKEITTLVTKRARGLHLGAPHIMVEKGSVNVLKMNNAMLSIIEVKPGTSFVPQSFIPGSVGPELAEALADLYAKAYELFGITQLQAQGLKPAGLDSGEAQRVYNNTASRRFKVAQENDERAVLQTVRLIMACARKIIARGGSVEVKAASSKSFEKLSFEDIQLAEEEHVLQMFPTSALANEPAERTQQVADWVKAGWIDPSAAKRLLNFPDLDAYQSLANASYDATMQMIDDIIDRGHYVGPTSYLDLGTIQAPGESVKLFGLAMIKAQRSGVAPARVAMLQRWLQQAKDIIAPPQPAQPLPPPGAVPPQPMPPDAAMPPPGAPPMQPPPQGAPPGQMVQ